MKWTTEDDTILDSCYSEVADVRALANRLQRGLTAVHQRASNRGLKRRPRWTDDETRKLIELCDSHERSTVAALLGRSLGGVIHKMKELGLQRSHWSDEELAVLREVYPQGILAATRRLGRSRYSVQRKAQQLGLRVTQWTIEQEDLLRQHYGRMPPEKLAALVGRGVWAMYSRANKLGLSAKGRFKVWTTEEDDLLRQHYGRMSTSALSKKTGRHSSTIHRHAKKLGLKPHPVGRPRI